MSFKSLKDVMESSVSEIPLDGNLAITDFEKIQNNQLAHLAFDTLDVFRVKNGGRLPEPWNK
jgi:hypothetical protein